MILSLPRWVPSGLPGRPSGLSVRESSFCHLPLCPIFGGVCPCRRGATSPASQITETTSRTSSPTLLLQYSFDESDACVSHLDRQFCGGTRDCHTVCWKTSTWIRISCHRTHRAKCAEVRPCAWLCKRMYRGSQSSSHLNWPYTANKRNRSDRVDLANECTLIEDVTELKNGVVPALACPAAKAYLGEMRRSGGVHIRNYRVFLWNRSVGFRKGPILRNTRSYPEKQRSYPEKHCFTE